MSFTVSDLKSLFSALASTMQRERDHLCALDGQIGDADHGIAMEQGMVAASTAVQAIADEATLQEGFNAAAKAFLNAVGASSGPLYATAFMRAAKAAGQRREMPRDGLREVIVAMRDGIIYRGKGAIGQKTMLDAWHPAAEAAANAASPTEIVEQAKQGAASTADMIATLGRAARLGERSRGHPDPGAVSAVLIISALAEAIRD